MSDTACHRIKVVNLDEEFRCSSDRSLLTGVEHQQKKAIQVGCRGGGCGICRIRILAGDYTAKKMSIKHVSVEQAAQGFALSCRVFPQSDMIIEADPTQ